MAEKEVEGTAQDCKAGAILVLESGEQVYIEDLDYWPDEFIGKKVVAKGTLVRKKFVPDPVIKADGTASQGASGVQLVLENARWTFAQ